MLKSIRAEWTKLSTVRSFYWTSILIVLLSWGFAAIMGYGCRIAVRSLKDKPPTEAADIGASFLTPDLALSGYRLFGLMVFIIMGALVVTSEYRFGTMRTTVMMIPNRPIIAITKVVVYGVISMVLAFISVIGSVAIAKWVAGSDAAPDIKVFDGMWRTYGADVLSALLMVVMAVGVGLLVRQTAGAVAILLLWKLVLEDLLTLIPKIGDKISPYRPFANLNAWVSENPVKDAPWGVNGSLIYFLVWVLAIYIVGVIFFCRRDA